MNERFASDSLSSLACNHGQQTSCSNCKLSKLCIPISLELEEIRKLETIVSKGRPVEKGAHIFRGSSPFKEIYAVRLGCIKTYRLDGNGAEQVTGFYLPGEIFGLDGIANNSHSESAVALETSAVCTIPFERMGELSADLPSLRNNMFQLMGQEITEDRKLISMLSKHGAELRMATLILSLSQRYSELGQSESRIRLPMSRGDIANYLGLTPETVSRVLNKLRKMSIIAIDNKELEILNDEALRYVAREADC